MNDFPGKQAKKSFSKAFIGYNTAEVDSERQEQSNLIASLSRRNAELEQKLAAAEARLSSLTDEEKQVKAALETARRAGDQIIRDSYARADKIQASVKKSCDGMLAAFREKVENARTELAAMQDNVAIFKQELFEKYRMHLELIDRLVPVYEDAALTASGAADKIITNIKREIAGEYNLKLEDVLTEEEQKAFLLEEMENVAKSIEEEAGLRGSALTERSKRDIAPAVMEKLREYEENAKTEVKGFGHQLSLDVDAMLSEKREEEKKRKAEQDSRKTEEGK